MPTKWPLFPPGRLAMLPCLTLPLRNGVFIVRPDIFNVNHFMLIASLPGRATATPPLAYSPRLPHSTQSRPAMVQLNIIVKIKPQLANCCCRCKTYLPIAPACHLLLLLLFLAFLNPLSAPFLTPWLGFFCHLLFLIVHSGNCLLTRRHDMQVRVCARVWADLLHGNLFSHLVVNLKRLKPPSPPA